MPTPTSSSSSPSFPLFPHLPPELRLQIYHHACHPRVTTLIYQEDAGNTTGTGTFRCPTHPPTLLHVSRESRAEGRRLYVQCFLPPPPPTNPFCRPDQEGREGEEEEEEYKRYFYHHPQLDTLYLPRPSPHPNPNNGANTNQFDSGFGFAHGGMSTSMSTGMGYASWACDFATTLLPDVARAVRRLAVDYVPGEVRRPWEVYGKVCLLRGCARLEEAFLVVGRSQQTRTTCGHHQTQEGQGQQNGEGEGEGEGAEVEFVDPRADDGEIVGIMERVRESFRVELGSGGGLGMGMGKEGMEENGEGREVGGLELIPKAKVVSTWGCRPVACAS